MDNIKIWLIGIPFAILMVALFIWSSVKDALRRKAIKEQYKKMSGRADGKISNFKMVRRSRYHNREEDVDYDAFMDYEFEVDGKIYKGHGEGSGALWKRKTQTICYDPEDPDNNCTLYIYDRKTGKTGCLTSLVVLITLVAIFGTVFYYFFKVKGIDIKDFGDFLKEYFHV
ncbi:MAG: hypothetical protein IKT14_05170 [Clostridiales bacterium]|nr:hypothetical protein [Clostridiales bacterium]